MSPAIGTSNAPLLVGHACLLAIFAALLGLLAGCDEKNEYVAPPPPQVTVSKPLQRPVIDYLELTGNTQAVETVDLTARVEGFLTAINFQDGYFVKEGDVLFVVEPEPYQARVKLAEATVEQQKATLARAEQEFARQLRLIKQNATSEADVENWRAQRDAAKAALDEAKANAELARINLSYTHVTAPFSGRIGRRLKDPGNLVGAGEATKLATIDRLDPIYAYFNVSERDVLRVKEMQRQRGYPDYRKAPVPVFLGLGTEEGYPHQGQVDFAATGIDPSTGTLLVRAIFPNPDNVLLPGVFVRIRVPLAQRDNALVVPERAIGVDQRGRYVLVVNDQNVVESRPVKVGVSVDGMRVIEEGMRPEEWVVVNGIQKARPGAHVNPVRQENAAPAAQAATKS